MKNKLKRLYAVVLLTTTLCLPPIAAASQIQDAALREDIAIMARPSGDSILLRWAPLSFKVWRQGNTNGYRIERYLILQNGHLLPEPMKVILAPSRKPLEVAEWEPLVRRDKYAAIAAQALYGDRFETDLAHSDLVRIADKARENEQRFAFALFSADMSPAVARASGLWFTDHTVKKGEKYLYRVVISSLDTIRGTIFVSPDDSYPLLKPQHLKVDVNGQVASLKWDSHHPVRYSAYRLERSTDGKSFSPLSGAPLVTVTPPGRENNRYEYAIDSLTILSQTYYYRVRGITPFGEESPASDVVTAKANPVVSQAPYIRAVDNPDNTSLEIQWDFQKRDNAAIQGFKVERSTGPADPFALLTRNLLGPDERAYRDEHPAPVNYYRVTALGLDGEGYSSHVYFAQLIDSIPPPPPAGVEGQIDDEGRVALTWTASAAADIYGYRIYKAYHKSEELAQLTSAPVKENRFGDTVDLRTLNEAVYYRVMAIDRNQNHSALSALLKIELPDKVNPQPPVLLPIENNASGIGLKWIPGASEDIARYEVYRRTPANEHWQRIAVIAANSTDTLFHYKDRSTPAGEENLYTVISVDDAGLESPPARAARGTKTGPSSAAPLTWQKPVVNGEENRITLRWDRPEPPPRSFRIYRAVNHRPPLVLTTLEGDEGEFTDTIIPGEHYAYRIMAVYENGRKSSLSTALQFQY